MANYAMYALLKLKILPSTFLEMDQKEQAFVIACADIRIEAEKEEAAKAKSKVKR